MSFEKKRNAFLAYVNVTCMGVLYIYISLYSQVLICQEVFVEPISFENYIWYMCHVNIHCFTCISVLFCSKIWGLKDHYQRVRQNLADISSNESNSAGEKVSIEMKEDGGYKICMPLRFEKWVEFVCS